MQRESTISDDTDDDPFGSKEKPKGTENEESSEEEDEEEQEDVHKIEKKIRNEEKRYIKEGDWL
jgi:nucleosome binding factor SPN SPT16 subunit